MKRVAAGVIMTVIAAGLFLFALGSEDFARLRVTEPGIWMVVFYAVVVVGLAQYRRWLDQHSGVSLLSPSEDNAPLGDDAAAVDIPPLWSGTGGREPKPQ